MRRPVTVDVARSLACLLYGASCYTLFFGALEKYSPPYPQGMEPRRYWHVRPYIRPTCYPAVSGEESVIRLSLGRKLVNLLPVVKQTNTPLIP